MFEIHFDAVCCSMCTQLPQTKWAAVVRLCTYRMWKKLELRRGALLPLLASNKYQICVFLLRCTHFICVGKNNCLEYWSPLMLLQGSVNDISREERAHARPCSASDDQVGTRQRACIIDASVYVMRPSVTLQGFLKEEDASVFHFLTIYKSVTSVFFSLCVCLKAPSCTPPTPIYITLVFKLV